MPHDNFDVDAVTLASATAWLRGNFHVGDHLRDCPELDFSLPEIAFLNVLGDRPSYRAAVAAALTLYERGAWAAVAHVTSPIMLAHYRKNGGLVCLTEEITWHGQRLTAARLLLPPAGWRAWCLARKRKHHRSSLNPVLPPAVHPGPSSKRL